MHWSVGRKLPTRVAMSADWPPSLIACAASAIRLPGVLVVAEAMPEPNTANDAAAAPTAPMPRTTGFFTSARPPTCDVPVRLRTKRWLQNAQMRTPPSRSVQRSPTRYLSCLQMSATESGRATPGTSPDLQQFVAHILLGLGLLLSLLILLASAGPGGSRRNCLGYPGSRRSALQFRSSRIRPPPGLNPLGVHRSWRSASRSRGTARSAAGRRRRWRSCRCRLFAESPAGLRRRSGPAYSLSARGSRRHREKRTSGQRRDGADSPRNAIVFIDPPASYRGTSRPRKSGLRA